MTKVKIDCTPQKNQGEMTLKASIALILAKAISMTDKRAHKPEEFMDTAESLIEILGEEDAKNLTLRKDIKETVLEFRMKPEEILRNSPEEFLRQEKNVIVDAIKDETPWYNKYIQPNSRIKNQRYQRYINKNFLKKTRKK